MAKTIATVIGIGFILAGLLGFIAPGAMGFHLSIAHTIVHLVSGALALYFGLKGTLAQARLFCIVFGAVYGLLGVVGFIAGGRGTPSGGHPGPADDHLFKLLPGVLELGTSDHVLHILLGLIFLVGGLMTKARLERAAD
ncbi:MAG: DUF4383 domain-containing protein [Blastocatellia bacterium]